MGPVRKSVRHWQAFPAYCYETL